MPKPRKKPKTIEAPSETPASQENASVAIGRAIDPAIIHQVFLWIACGATEFQIREGIAREWPDLEASVLMSAAFQQIASTGTMDVGLIRGWCIEAGRELYRRAMLAGDLDGALRSLAVIARVGCK